MFHVVYGMVCDLINENSIVTYHAIMHLQAHTFTHKQHTTNSREEV